MRHIRHIRPIRLIRLLGFIGLICLIGLISLIGLSGNYEGFRQDLFTNTLSARGENFAATLSEVEGLPKQEFTSGKSKITATLVNHKTNKSNTTNWTNKFIPTAKATYNLTNNTSLEYEVIKEKPADGQIAGNPPAGIKENIVLNSKDSPRSFQFKLDLEGISRYANLNGNWYFYDSNGNSVFYIPAAFMEDAKSNRSYSVLLDISKNDKQEVILTLAADSEWLDAPDRAWPVKIDPSVIVTGGIVEAETQFGGLQRKVVYANNNWYAFYNDNGKVLYKKSANGTIWKAPVDLDTTDGDNYNPTTWQEGQYIYTAWIDDSSDAIEVNRIDTSAEGYSLSTRCTSADQGTIGSTFTVSLAVSDDGTVYVAYTDTSSDTETGIFKLTFSGCSFTDIGTTSSDTTVYLTTADTSPWTVPSDFTSTNTIRAIGGGGAGDNLTTGGGGGGGGAYASLTNLNLGIGTTVPFGIGAGGTDAVNGGPTFFNSANAAACTAGSSVCVKAAGGTTATNATGGAGGTAAGSVGIGGTFPGGDGGTGDAAGTDSTGGGGGAGSPNGTGGTGGNGDSNAGGEESHGGGGGAGCDSIGTANDGVAGGIDGGNGGDSCFAAGGTGADAANGNPGTRGSGGGGGDEGSGTDDGGVGGAGLNTDDISRAGGGGGGGDDDAGGVGGAGGLYGGGGGGGETIGLGKAGNIAITYSTNVPILTSADNPVLVTIGNNLHMVFQDGNLSHSIYNGSSWTTSNTTIASVTDSNYDITTDGTNIWVLTDAAADTTNTNLYKYTASWSTLTAPWTSQTNVTSVSITYDSTNSDLVAHIIKDTSEQAYTKTSDATTISWGSENSYGFTAGDLGHISSPMTAAGVSQIGVVLRQNTNFEFALSPPVSRLYWKFEDASGTKAEDSSTYNLDGTLNNTPTWKTEDFCVYGKCLYFDGTSNENVSRADDANLDFGASNSFTVEAWAKRDGASSAINYIITKAAGGTYAGYKLYMDASGDLCFDTRDGTNAADSACTSAVEFDDDKWHHVVGIKSAATSVTLYVDGVERATDTSIVSTGTLENTGTFYVGVDLDGTTSEWLGFIDEVKVFSGARTATQIKSDYNARGVLSASVILGNAAPPGSVLSNGLVGYWKADEASYTGNCSAADLADSSGNGSSGKTCPNAAGPTVATGKFSNGTNFDGSNDYVEAGDSTLLHMDQSKSMTFAAWIKIDNTGLVQNIFRYDDCDNVDGDSNCAVDRPLYGFRLLTTNNLQFLYGPGGNSGASTSRTLSANTWYHVVAVRDTVANTHKVYINGTLDVSGTDTSTGSWETTGQYLVLGRYNPSEFFDGTMDELRVYTRALSGNEVSTLYNFAPGPVGYWKFDEKQGTAAEDSSGNGNQATLTNSPTWTSGKYGSAINFPGSNAHVIRADDADFDFVGGDSFALEAWFKHNASPGTQEEIISKFATQGYKLLMETDGDITCTITDSAAQTDTATSTAATYDDNLWHHVACVKNVSTSLTLYIDGVQVAQDATIGATATLANTDPLYIGIDEDATSEDWVGQIDEPKIYNYARTAKQIVEDMNAGHPAPGSPVGSPVGHWKFDEGSGTKANNSGSQGVPLRGSLTNMASPATSTSGWTQAGKFGKALIFDSTNDLVNAGSDASIDNLTANPMSVSAWIYPNTMGESSQGVIMAKNSGATPSSGWLLQFSGTNALKFSVDGSTDLVRTTSNNAITLGAWNYVTLTWDGTFTDASKVRIYVNGRETTYQTTTNGVTIVSDAASTLYIGNDSSAASTFDGTIDEVKIYNGQLTTSQVLLDMNKGAALVMGALSDSTSYQPQASNQEYCVPGDTTSCAAPVGRWDFEENNGSTVNDASGNANTGTWNGTLGSQWTKGKTGKAGSFNGTDNLVNAGSGSSLNLTGNMTLEAWVKPTSFNYSTAGIVVGREDSSQNYHLLFVGNGYADMALRGNGGIDNAGAGTILLNQWSHLAGVYDGSNLIIYVNGIKANSKAYTFASKDMPSDSTGIGKNPTDPASYWNYFKGLIDGVRVFNYARTPAQIAWDYNRGAPVGWWKFDECQGTTLNDSSINGNGQSNGNNGAWSGSTGTNTSAGSCSVVDTATAWYNGVTGKFNSSLDFEGTDDAVTVSDTANLRFDAATLDFSLFAWVKRTTTGTEYILSKEDADNDGYRLQFNSSNQVLCSQDATDVTSTSTVTDTNWHFVGCTIDRDGNGQVYIDGLANGATVSMGSDAMATTSNITIGTRSYTSTSYLNGQIDDVKIFNYALTPLQIKTLMNNGAVRYGPSTGAP